MTNQRITQNDLLKKHFKQAKSLTQLEATVNLGIMRLSERVRELERQGWQFAHKRIAVPSRFGGAYVAQYELVVAPETTV